MKTYKGIDYIVHLTETTNSYCGYVKLPDNHPFTKYLDQKRWYQIGKNSPRRYSNNYMKIPLDCHGGLTFGEKIKRTDWPQGFTKGYWVGWDYMHLGDYHKYSHSGEESDGIHWTEDMVEQEVKEVIEQLLNVKI